MGVCDLGLPTTTALSLARSPRRASAVLHDQRPTEFAVRLGDQGAVAPSRQSRARSIRRRSTRSSRSGLRWRRARCSSGVQSCRPAHSLAVEHRTRRLPLLAAWSLEPPRSATGRGRRRSRTSLLELLSDATRIRLRSDVPVGAYLSGGLDSSLITALIKLFADGTPADVLGRVRRSRVRRERVSARGASRSLGTEPRRRCACSCADIAPRVPRRHLARGAADPANGAGAALFLLSRLVRDSGYKVVLTGEGADEMFGGYDIFKEAKIRALLGRAAAFDVAAAAAASGSIPTCASVQSQSPTPICRPSSGARRALCEPLLLAPAALGADGAAEGVLLRRLRRELGAYDALDDLQTTLPRGLRGWDWFSRRPSISRRRSCFPVTSSRRRAIECRWHIRSRDGSRSSITASSSSRRAAASAEAQGARREVPAEARARDRWFRPPWQRRPKQPYRAPGGERVSCADRRGMLPTTSRSCCRPAVSPQDGIFNPAAVESAGLAKTRAGGPSASRDNMALVGVLSTQLVDRSLQARSRISAGHRHDEPFSGR